MGDGGMAWGYGMGYPYATFLCNMYVTLYIVSCEGGGGCLWIQRLIITINVFIVMFKVTSAFPVFLDPIRGQSNTIMSKTKYSQLQYKYTSLKIDL